MLQTELHEDPLRLILQNNVQRYNMGVIPTKKTLALCDKLSVSSFRRRRLPTVLVQLQFAEHLKEVVTYIEMVHIQVGRKFLVAQNMEDFITWVDSSKIKRKVLQCNDKLDEYDMMK
ncbi:hypothetical protein MLD38_037125 [Melastoma candidum]|uniref:Uncharacterized protein n=1 Tax=Melastoma candidum TaxID=119954 RepID=A0ACB9LLS3_9MYRT|nr:hypothetical protein MLD38_037125 [Melastoma candidum]